MLNRVDVVKLVSDVLAKHMAGNAMLPMVLQLVDQIVRQNEAGAKKKLYALAMSYVFSVELGPLVTALLLAGRIGGSYAGEVGMMAATHQLELLSVLGVPRLGWTFVPAALAALLAAPLLTAVGTAVALYVGALVAGPQGFALLSADEYWADVHEVVLAPGPQLHWLKYPPAVNAYRALGFMASTMAVAQLCAGARRRLQPRHVPLVITTAVVTSCLLVICMDWGFSQLYVHIDDVVAGVPMGGGVGGADGGGADGGADGAAMAGAAAAAEGAMGGGLGASEEEAAHGGPEEFDGYYDDYHDEHGDEL